MPDNGQGKSNAVSNQSADAIQDAILRLKVHDDREPGDVADSISYPDRPGEPNCSHYIRTGMCGYGNNCRFNHPRFGSQGDLVTEELPKRLGQPDCEYFLRTGACKYGSSCKYHHPVDRNGAGPVLFNVLGLPMRQDEKSCSYYMRTGTCKFGVACKFDHPQPASAGMGFPVRGPATLLPTGSSAAPTSVPTYMGSPWSLPRVPPYMSGSHLQGPQSYVVFSPSQSIVHGQGWNTYVGSLTPASPTSALVYNSRNQGELCSGRRQLQTIPTMNHNLPERPEQPECRYYMTSGTCKHGFDCKYNHPKERIAQPAYNVLPSRPGGVVCSTYSRYGICKYGPTCSFDHPFVGYPYTPNLPPLTLVNYPIIPTPHLSATYVSSKFEAPKAARNKQLPPEVAGSPPQLSQSSSES